MILDFLHHGLFGEVSSRKNQEAVLKPACSMNMGQLLRFIPHSVILWVGSGGKPWLCGRPPEGRRKLIHLDSAKLTPLGNAKTFVADGSAIRHVICFVKGTE